ncbi:MAG: hypothetical protein K9M15_02720 [Candidatus Marinimicrobia bacterium]|nr:hypothetical protein [Candidatus Neomarinimicrobiota bacterium]
MKTRVQKGKILEKYVADQLREKGIDEKAYPAHGSGNTTTEKSDIWTSMMIHGQNAGIECKNQKVVKIPEWWKQTRKLESLGREPILVFKLHMDPLEGTLATIYLDTLLDLVKEIKQLEEKILKKN